MRQTAFALILGSFLAVGLPAADQQLVNMVMPDAKALAGMNVTSTRNSPFGTFLLRQASANNADLQKFEAESGFNPQTDLDEILVATVGPSATPTDPTVVAPSPGVQGLILARGNFNIEKITAFAKINGKQQIQDYNGATLLSDPKNPSTGAMAFVGPNYAVAGDLATVKAALDRRSQANSLDPQLTTKVNSLSASQDAWAVSIAPLTGLNSGSADPAALPLQGALNGDLFKKITQTSGGIKFGEQIQLSTELVAMDEKNATALGDVVKFLVGMATMNAGTAKGAPPAVISLLQSLTVQTQGNVVSLGVSVPEEQLEGLINSMGTTPAKKPAAKI